MGMAIDVDVSRPEDNDRLVDQVEELFGPVDLFCANAGIGFAGDEQTAPDDWDRMWQVNVMSHVHAARRLIPSGRPAGDGYFLATVSAAGLLTNLKAAQYSVTKHAALAFAEWLAITYGDQGVKVSCLCPMGVRTPFLESATEFHDLLVADRHRPGDRRRPGGRWSGRGALPDPPPSRGRPLLPEQGE